MFKKLSTGLLTRSELTWKNIPHRRAVFHFCSYIIYTSTELSTLAGEPRGPCLSALTYAKHFRHTRRGFPPPPPRFNRMRLETT